ncbi:MAG: hypothetical protein LJE67_09020 [Salaquimonas sp.]|nr:hypothetical protein [Salaquimonas sp.]
MVLRKLCGAAAMVAAMWASVANAQPASYVQSKTYLINGLASAVPFIGYGFTNLQKKIPGAELYSYISPVEGSMVIEPKIMADIRRQYRANPDIEINLIGISYGANLITRMVQQLDKEGIPVSYLGVLDGLPLAKVTPNVRRVDNFICNFPGCLRDKVRLTRGNDNTIQANFNYNTSHIALGNNEEVHTRILHQIASYPLNVAGDLDYAYTASTQ